MTRSSLASGFPSLSDWWARSKTDRAARLRVCGGGGSKRGSDVTLAELQPRSLLPRSLQRRKQRKIAGRADEMRADEISGGASAGFVSRLWRVVLRRLGSLRLRGRQRRSLEAGVRQPHLRAARWKSGGQTRV